MAVTVILEVDHFKRVVDLLLDFVFCELTHILVLCAVLCDVNRSVRNTFHLESEGYVFEDVEVREERITLKHRIERSFIGRHIGNVLAVEENRPLLRLFKARNYSERRRFSATGRSEKSDELALFNGQADVFDGGFSVITFVDVFKFDDVFCFFLLFQFGIPL